MKEWKVDLRDPETWRRRLAVSREIRDTRARQLGWDRAQDAFQGKLLAEVPSQDTVVVNFPYAYVSNILPSVYFSQPRILVRPTKEAYRQAAQLLEPLLNYQIRRLRFSRQARRAILDAIIIGHGWVKLGWATKYGEIPGESPRNEPLSAGKKITIRNIRFREGSPFFYRIDPRMMLVDPRASSWEEVRWVAQLAYRPYDYLMDDPFIQNKDKISPGYRLEGSQDMQVIPRDQRDRIGEAFCLCYEIWDLDSERVMMLAEGSSDWQRFEKWPYPYLDGVPFYFLQAGDGIDDIYPVSPLSMWLDQVDELSKIRTLQLDALYRARGKLVVQQGALDNEELEKLRDPQEDIIVAKDINGIQAIKTLTLDPNAYICEDRVKRDIMDISGLSELQYGNLPGGRVTATLGMIAQRSTTVRLRRFVDAIRDWLIDVAGDMAVMLAHKMPEPQQVAITTQGGLDWLEITRADIQGEFLFDLDVSEMAPLSREARQKEAVDLVSLLSQAPDIAKRRRLYEDVLEAFGKTEPDAYLKPEMGPPVDPQYENELMVQGIEILPNPEEDVQLHLRVHGDFIQGPLYQSVARDVPAVANIFSAHIQRTMAMARELPQAKPAAGAGAPRLGANAAQLEQGRVLAAAQPPVVPEGLGGM